MSSRARPARRARGRVAAAAPAARAHEPVARAAAPPARWPWAWPLAVALVAFGVFWPALGGGFLDWDDALNLVDNPAFRGLGWSNLGWMFTTTLAGHWIPLTWISFGLDYRLWGMNPLGYHLTNVLLHAAAAAVFYLVALRLLRLAVGGPERRLRIGALAAALFFAIHPLRVESVAWITERRDVLSGLLFLLAIAAYLAARGGGGSSAARVAGRLARVLRPGRDGEGDRHDPADHPRRARRVPAAATARAGRRLDRPRRPARSGSRRSPT